MAAHDIDPDLLEDWAATRIVLERPVPVVLAGSDASADWPFAGEVTIVTAANPRSLPLPEAENRTRTQALADDLRAHGHDVEPATAGHHGWHEPSLAVPDLPDQAARHACQQYEQLGFFVLDATSVRIVATATGEVLHVGPRHHEADRP